MLHRKSAQTVLRVSLIVALGLGALAVACADDESAGGGPGGSGSGSGGGGSGGSSASGGTGGTGAVGTGGASASGGSGGTSGTGGAGTGGVTDAGDAGEDATASETSFLAVDQSNRLVKFRRSALGSIDTLAITGLETNERIVGIDIRPATGQLYVLGNSPRLYVVDPTNGAAVQVGGAIAGITGADLATFALDFNPIVDRIRLMTDFGGNYRLNPDTAIVTPDTQLAFAPGDANELSTPTLVGCAYLPAEPDGGTTTLYAIDLTTASLTTVDPPNAGMLHTVGPLGVELLLDCGFDILDEDGTATAYAAIQPPATSASTLYTINLTTGDATALGVVGGSALVALTATR
jgi:hypothetical protein